MKIRLIRQFLFLLALFFTGCSSPAPGADLPPPTLTEKVEATTSSHNETPTVSPEPPAHAATNTPQTSSSGPVAVSVDTAVRYQTIEGFGATHLSLMYESAGDVLGQELRSKAIDAIYRQVGINLGNLEGSLLESPGSYDQRSNDNSDPNEIDWARFQTYPADAILSNLLSLAEPLGFDGYYVNQRVNIRWASPWLIELRDSDYDRYLEEAVEQVVAGNIYWRDRYSVVPRYIMPFNEPLSGNEELQSDNVQEVVDLVKAIGSRLEEEGFANAQFVLPNEETVHRTLEVATAILSDPAARKYAGVIGYHSYPYGSTYASVPNILSTSGAGMPDANSVEIRDRLRQLSQQYGLPVWMTEVSHGEVDPFSYEDFRGRAIHIHDEFLYANASAYFGMTNMWDTFSQEAHFGNQDLSSAEGTIVLIDIPHRTVSITGMGYAIGHYARWIEPGAVRVEALSGDPLMQISAFISPESDQLILVLINNHTVPKEINVDLNSAQMAGSVSGEQSTPSQYWTPIPELETSSPVSFAATLPAESVTTFAMSLVP